ncbi:PLC-like phosphodiesterase [Parachaetomium inaequale]|uniref:PLC-like phosphodiesterase n=1 Tax=Parachaetomium inaequale TaxID=2588326 RepID=A0AAN6SVR2_9PEZI|nr:PLC-like phosphodiesterase [Parachaetomium inaequale]
MRAFRLLAVLASSAWLLVSGQTDDVCKAQDRTYSTEAVPAGSYQPYDKLNPVVGVLSTKFYVTVVNLTPHRIRLQNTHSYQMDTFDFGDVPQGRARQNTVKYRGTWHTKDDAGEAYYRLDGTDKTFALRVKSYSGSDPRRVVLDLSGMGLGQREYVFPGGETAVSLVITGSNRFGFQASLRHGPGNWMRKMYDVIRDRPVRHLIMPGTHDAGMSKITDKITSIGSEENTQNQGVNIYDQLRAGSRWFDLRVGSIHPNDDAGKNNGFWVMHVNDEMAMLAIGNTGESLDEVISEINRFTAENPGEIIFFTMRYLVGRYEFPDRGPIMWNTGLVNDFFSKLRTINNRCLNLDTSTGFQNQQTSYFMDQNEGKGCVILLLNGHLDGGVPRESPGDGVYDGGRMGVRDHWSNKMQASDMAPDQVSNWRSATRGGASDFGSFMIAQWLVTPDALASTAYTLQNFAIQPTNPSLYWEGVNGMDPEHWPNVLLVDYIGVQQRDQWAWDRLSAEIYTLGVGMNLYMASENCDVNKRRPPLLRRGEVAVESREQPWNGIIFANGTTVDSPPPTLHPGRVEILRNGTVFSNGTVLERSIPNPWL